MFEWPKKNNRMCRKSVSLVFILVKFDLNIWREENYKLNKNKNIKVQIKTQTLKLSPGVRKKTFNFHYQHIKIQILHPEQ